MTKKKRVIVSLDDSVYTLLNAMVKFYNKGDYRTVVATKSTVVADCIEFVATQLSIRYS